MLVKAISLGIYKHHRRRPGDVFEVDDWEKEQGKWMVPVSDADEVEDVEEVPKPKKKLRLKKKSKPAEAPKVEVDRDVI